MYFSISFLLHSSYLLNATQLFTNFKLFNFSCHLLKKNPQIQCAGLFAECDPPFLNLFRAATDKFIFTMTTIILLSLKCFQQRNGLSDC